MEPASAIALLTEDSVDQYSKIANVFVKNMHTHSKDRYISINAFGVGTKLSHGGDGDGGDGCNCVSPELEIGKNQVKSPRLMTWLATPPPETPFWNGLTVLPRVKKPFHDGSEFIVEVKSIGNGEVSVPGKEALNVLAVG
jgi:hypothetical protein